MNPILIYSNTIPSLSQSKKKKTFLGKAYYFIQNLPQRSPDVNIRLQDSGMELQYSCVYLGIHYVKTLNQVQVEPDLRGMYNKFKSNKPPDTLLS